MSKANDFTEDTVPTPEENGVLDEPIPAAAAPPEDDVSVCLDETDTPRMYPKIRHLRPQSLNAQAAKRRLKRNRLRTKRTLSRRRLRKMRRKQLNLR